MNDLYERVIAHLKDRDMQGLKLFLGQADLDALLTLFQELTSDERIVAFRLLDKQTALALFEQLDLEQRQDLISTFTHEQTLAIFTDLDPDDRARLLDELPAAVAKRLVEALSPQEREQINLLLGYGPETAGRIMTPKYVRLTQAMTVAEALEKVRAIARPQEIIHTLYVTDAERRLVGKLP